MSEAVDFVRKNVLRYEIVSNKNTTLELTNSLKKAQAVFKEAETRIVEFYEIDGAGDKKLLERKVNNVFPLERGEGVIKSAFKSAGIK